MGVITPLQKVKGEGHSDERDDADILRREKMRRRIIAMMIIASD